MTQQEIMHALRQLRKEKNLTLDKYAELIGMNKCHISGVENGKRNISLSNLLKMAEVLEAEIVVRVPEN